MILDKCWKKKYDVGLFFINGDQQMNVINILLSDVLTYGMFVNLIVKLTGTHGIILNYIFSKR